MTDTSAVPPDVSPDLRRARRVAMGNQICATGLFSLTVLLWLLEFLADRRRAPGELIEPYAWVLGVMLLPFAFAFQFAAVGWWYRAPWRWWGQAAPLGALLFVAKACF